MKFLTKLIVLFVLAALCLSAHADGWLHNNLGYYNTFYVNSWNTYMGKYNLSTQPQSLDDGTGRAYYWVGGYEHCFSGVFFLQTEDANGNRNDLVFASLDDAKNFEADLNRAIYPVGTRPSNSASVFEMSLAGGLKVDQIALPYRAPENVELGLDSIQLHFLKSELPINSCAY